MACLTSGGIQMALNHRTRRTDSLAGHVPHPEGRGNGPLPSGVSQSLGLGSAVSESPGELVQMQIPGPHVGSKLCRWPWGPGHAETLTCHRLSFLPPTPAQR